MPEAPSLLSPPASQRYSHLSPGPRPVIAPSSRCWEATRLQAEVASLQRGLQPANHPAAFHNVVNVMSNTRHKTVGKHMLAQDV
jgi:hypothetical protein